MLWECDGGPRCIPGFSRLECPGPGVSGVIHGLGVHHPAKGVKGMTAIDAGIFPAALDTSETKVSNYSTVPLNVHAAY